jgi:DNA-binding response OmpR family regulator
MSTSLPRPRVLAINTDDGILALIAAALTEAGFEALTCRLADLNSEGGFLSYATKLLPDAIVYDVGPPYMENWERLQGVIASGAVTAPVIITSTDPDILRDKVGASPAAGFVGKPFEIAELIGSVRDALDHSRPV